MEQHNTRGLDLTIRPEPERSRPFILQQELEMILRTNDPDSLPREGWRFRWWDGERRRELLVIDLTDLAVEV